MGFEVEGGSKKNGQDDKVLTAIIIQILDLVLEGGLKINQSVHC